MTQLPELPLTLSRQEIRKMIRQPEEQQHDADTHHTRRVVVDQNSPEVQRIALGNIYTEEAYQLLKKLEFKNMLSRFSVEAPANEKIEKSLMRRSFLL